MILKCSVLLLFCELFDSFTLSTTNFYLISDPSGQNDSYFGYSLLLRSSLTGYDASIIIGAPTANSPYKTHQVLDRPGAVYQCLLKPKFSNFGTQCRQLILDPAGNDNGTQHDHEYRPEKSQAWIGAAIDGDNIIEGLFIACGPRWKDQMYENFILPNGICYFMKNTLTMNSIARSFIPLIDKSKQVYMNSPYYAFGEAGFAVHLTQQKIKRVLLGAVGVYVFKGIVIETDFEQINNKEKQMKIMNPKDINQLTDNSYLGYSLGSGVFLNNSSDVWVVSGAPRGASLNGQVFMMKYDQNDNLEILDVLEGDQLGSYFGATVCVVDLNSDGVSDLLIGAPMYTTHISDEGAVYVFFGNGEGKFIKKDQIYVENIGPNSRFGSAISHLADINNDRYVDVVIGAPYENDGTGSIYVYLGTRNGLEKQFIQRISALDLSPILKAFGSSFSRNLDIDKNQCNDIAVGAYKSGHVVVLLSKPEIRVDTILEPNMKTVASNTTAITLHLCFNYSGIHAPRNLIIDVHLGVDKQYQRTDILRQKRVFNGIAVFNKSLMYEKRDCEDIILRIKKNIRQTGNPIDVSLSYSVRNMDKYEFKNPILNPRSRNNFSLSIFVEREFSLQIIRQSIPNQLLYISGVELEPKKRLEHNYDIVNNGPSPTQQLLIIFYIPTIKNFKDQNKKIELIKLETSELYVNDVTTTCQVVRNEFVSKRYLGPHFEENLKLDPKKTEYINCSSGENITCERLKCFVPKISVNSTPIIVKLKLNSQWNNYYKLADGKKDLILYTSIMQITCKPLCKNTAEYYFTHTMIYMANPIKISIWITLCAILIGLGVLLIIAFVLYKFGFYQRKQHDRLRLMKDSAENETFYEDFDTDVAID